jgi:hypothetical protein
MMWKTPLGAVLSVGLVAGSAGDAWAKVQILGPGAGTSCGTWLEDRDANRAGVDESWILGFLSGIGYALGERGIDPLHDTDHNGVTAWIDNYCRGHPIDLISAAAAALVTAHPR